ncbi:MAG: hypothetical protein E3J66_07235 [Dehalococcoidia bacterium]|nr:MAG: hypothetical protein E3J66_07235 [Dehalococcoidia bacterium]
MRGKKFRINCGSKYFELKYGPNSIIEIEEELDFHTDFNPPSFLYIGRVLAEGKPELLRGKTYYGHVNGLGEFVHETELGEEVKGD